MRFTAVSVVLLGLLVSSCSRDTRSAEGTDRVQSTSQNLPILTVVDKPKDGAAVSQTMEVAGWALIPDGTRSVTVSIDGKANFPAQINVPRADVAHAYPQYQNDTAGWNVLIPLAGVNPGHHSVSISATSNSGKQIGISTLKVIVK